MTAILYLIPVSLGLGLLALAGFLWTIRSGQYDDLEGDSYRILTEDGRPLPPEAARRHRAMIRRGGKAGSLR